MVLAPGGGAVAFLAPTALSYNARALIVADAFLQAAFAGEGSPGGVPVRLGDALRIALGEYARRAGRDLYLPSVFTLLGDPATPLAP